MDKLPCSTSFLMSINFDGLKEVIEFFHKNLNIMNDKINDINKKFKGYEDIQNQLKENKIKTESGLRLLSELERTINNFSINIMDNSKKISINKDNLEVLKEDIEKIKLDNKNLSSEINELYSELNQVNKLDENNKNENDNENSLKTEIDKIRDENKENFDKLINKIDELDIKMKDIENKKEKLNDINLDINEKNEDNKKEEEENKNENINDIILYQDLSKRVGQLEEKINKMSDEINNEIILPNQNKTTEIKNVPLSNAENKLEEETNNNINLVSNYDDRLNKIDNKLSKLENDILSLQINNNKDEKKNLPSFQEVKNINNNKLNNNKIEKIVEINQKEEKDNSDNKGYLDKDIHEKINLLQKQIFEIMIQIEESNNNLSPENYLRKDEFIKYTKKVDVQLKEYNDKINNIFSKNSMNTDVLKKLSLNNVPTKFEKSDNQKSNKNLNTAELIESLEATTRTIILEYLEKLDLSKNTKIIEIGKVLESQNHLINELNSKILDLSNQNINQNKKYVELLENTKNEIENDIKDIENKMNSIPILREEIDFNQGMLFGADELEKYKKMSKEERNNEILLGTSLKEEMKIHGDYLKKLSEGINKVNNRINNLNKENLALIKKDLKNESNFILEDFKSGLKVSISKIEAQLKDKVDKLGLDQFWNKINEQLIEGMKNKIDKKEMNKNNIYLKRKIDNLESKISRTLVDTLIDLQMDEAPLLVKKNFREITEQKCASCGQNLQNVTNNGLLGYSLDFNNFGTNQHKNIRIKNVDDKDKLPEIKINLQK